MMRDWCVRLHNDVVGSTAKRSERDRERERERESIINMRAQNGRKLMILESVRLRIVSLSLHTIDNAKQKWRFFFGRDDDRCFSHITFNEWRSINLIKSFNYNFLNKAIKRNVFWISKSMRRLPYCARPLHLYTSHGRARSHWYQKERKKKTKTRMINRVEEENEEKKRGLSCVKPEIYYK